MLAEHGLIGSMGDSRPSASRLVMGCFEEIIADLLDLSTSSTAQRPDAKESQH
jgi:hypothetical protein